MKEEWRPIEGHPGYEVSDRGRVRSRPRVVMGGFQGARKMRLKGRVLRQSNHPTGMKRIWLGAARSTYVAHLVLAAFVGPRPAGMYARFRDGRKRNSKLSNLFWGQRAPEAKPRAPRRRRRTAPQSATALGAVI